MELPAEMWYLIIGFLNGASLLSARGVNLSWQKWAQIFLGAREIYTARAALIWAWPWHHRLCLRQTPYMLSVTPLYKLEITGHTYEDWHGNGLRVAHFVARKINLLSWPQITDSAHFTRCRSSWSLRVPKMTFHYCEIREAQNESCQDLEIVEDPSHSVLLRDFPQVRYSAKVTLRGEVKFLHCGRVMAEALEDTTLSVLVQNTNSLSVEKGLIFLQTLSPLETLEVKRDSVILSRQALIKCRQLILFIRVWWGQFCPHCLEILQVSSRFMHAEVGAFPNVHTLRDAQSRAFTHPSCPAALLEN